MEIKLFCFGGCTGPGAGREAGWRVSLVRRSPGHSLEAIGLSDKQKQISALSEIKLNLFIENWTCEN